MFDKLRLVARPAKSLHAGGMIQPLSRLSVAEVKLKIILKAAKLAKGKLSYGKA